MAQVIDFNKDKKFLTRCREKSCILHWGSTGLGDSVAEGHLDECDLRSVGRRTYFPGIWRAFGVYLYTAQHGEAIFLASLRDS